MASLYRQEVGVGAGRHLDILSECDSLLDKCDVQFSQSEALL